MSFIDSEDLHRTSRWLNISLYQDIFAKSDSGNGTNGPGGGRNDGGPKQYRQQVMNGGEVRGVKIVAHYDPGKTKDWCGGAW